MLPAENIGRKSLHNCEWMALWFYLSFLTPEIYIYGISDKEKELAWSDAVTYLDPHMSISGKQRLGSSSVVQGAQPVSSSAKQE